MTTFRQVKNGALSTVTGSAFNNTTTPLTFSVQAGHGARFPQPGNGFWATIWNATTYPNPLDDPLMEIVLVTARSTDSLTATRGQLGTTNVAHPAATQKIQLLVQDQQITDLNTAVDTLEDNTPVGAWTSYTPTWTATVTPLIGNGTLTGYYQRSGKTITARVNLTAGSTTTYGSGTWFFGLPVTAAATMTASTMIGVAYVEDAGSFAYSGMVQYNTTTTCSVGVLSASGAYTSFNPVSGTLPMTWASGDHIRMTITYEAA